MGDDTFTIGTLASRAGVGVQTVRYYERIGLLPRPGRTKSGYRRYGSDALARLQFVRHASQLGFTLSETSELLALRARQGAPCASVRTRAAEKLAAIERKLTELRQIRDAVAQLLRSCSGDRAIEQCSILAALDQPHLTKEGSESCPPPPPARRRASRASKRANAASKTV